MAANATLRLKPGPEAVGVARDAVTDAVEGHVEDECLDILRLLVSEVVTNSVRHSRTAAELELALSVNAEVVVSVTDRGIGFTPRQRAGAPEDVGGWGLYLVDELSSQWGVARNGSTRVWFSIPA